MSKHAGMQKTSARLLDTADEETASALAALLPQVSSHGARLTRSRIDSVVSSASTQVIVAEFDGRIVGMALLCICTTLAGQFGLVEEVTVDESARGNHVGVELMVTLLETAERLGLDFVELTSRPEREAANDLYPFARLRTPPHERLPPWALKTLPARR